MSEWPKSPEIWPQPRVKTPGGRKDGNNTGEAGQLQDLSAKPETPPLLHQTAKSRSDKQSQGKSHRGSLPEKQPDQGDVAKEQPKHIEGGNPRNQHDRWGSPSRFALPISEIRHPSASGEP